LDLINIIKKPVLNRGYGGYMEYIKEIQRDKLADILNNKLDFVLESYILNEHKICVKPVYKFKEAYICDINIPEFCLVYSEADDEEEIFVSVNYTCSHFENFCKEITKKYKNANIIFHGEKNNPESEDSGEFSESFYFDGKTKKHTDSNLCFKLLTLNDGNLKNSFEPDPDCYLNTLFNDFIESKIYHDCGIIGLYDEKNNFAGYLAYYEITENIRDISYLYIGDKYRGLGYGKNLLNFFVNKNIDENKISYYSYTADDVSIKLALSGGFMGCAKRYENI